MARTKKKRQAYMNKMKTIEEERKGAAKLL